MPILHLVASLSGLDLGPRANGVDDDNTRSSGSEKGSGRFHDENDLIPLFDTSKVSSSWARLLDIQRGICIAKIGSLLKIFKS